MTRSRSGAHRRYRPGVRGTGALVGLASALLALGPALRPGYLLFYDMVFVPRLGFSDRTLGVDGNVPRAVPNDLMVALASHVVPGWVVQKALLILVFVGVGAGVGALLGSRLGAAAAAMFATWNPYLAERLAIGHWGFLLGYACLPFLATAASAVRRGEPRGRFRLGLWTVVVALTGSTGAVLGLLLVLAVLTVPVPGTLNRAQVRRGRETLWALAIFVLANAAWWFPSIFVGSVGTGDKAGVEAFMARADTPWGVFGSLITGGGIWNRATWTPGRSSVLISATMLLVVLVCVGSAAWCRAWRGSAAYAGLSVAGVVGLLIAGAGAIPGGTALVDVAVEHVPGAGLLRDSQKFVALWVVLVAVCAGLGAERLRAVGVSWGVDRGRALAVAGTSALWPLVLLTGLAWGLGGQWSAVSYPASFESMRATISAQPPGAVAIFPWTLYRRYPFDNDQVLLDPWQRLSGRDVLVNDDLPLSNQVVRGESPDAARITAALAGRGDVRATLRSAGVRYALDQTGRRDDRATMLPALLRTDVVARAGDLVLYDLGSVPPSELPQHGTGPWRYLGLAGLVLAPAVVLVQELRRRRREVTEESPRSPDCG